MEPTKSKRKGRWNALDTGPQEIPAWWSALAALAFAVIIITVVRESDVYHRHPTEAADPARVDINYATVEELDTLPGVGASLAKAIIAARPYSRAEDLSRVNGISPKMVERLRPLIKATQGRRTADQR